MKHLEISRPGSGAAAVLLRYPRLDSPCAGDDEVWLWYFWKETIERFAKQYLPHTYVEISRVTMSQGASRE